MNSDWPGVRCAVERARAVGGGGGRPMGGVLSRARSRSRARPRNRAQSICMARRRRSPPACRLPRLAGLPPPSLPGPGSNARLHLGDS